MSGSVKMYRVRQIVHHDFPVQLPDCMYKVKNIHVSRTGVAEQLSVPQDPTLRRNLDISDQNNQNLPEMAQLQARQEQILQQLAQLKKQMDSIKANLNITSNTTASQKVSPKPPKDLPDIIVNASPTHPPYSLEVIQKQWSNEVFLSIKTYLHSTITGLSEPVCTFSKKLETFAPRNPSARKINVKLIWKDVGANTELIVSHMPIVGETNLLRFLARYSSSHLNYESFAKPENIDSLLDISHLLVHARTKTERAGLLQQLNKSLGKGQWLDGRNNFSIADLAAFSAIKQVASTNEINVNVGKWMERCQAL